jgi:CXXX repeat peptide maturase
MLHYLIILLDDTSVSYCHYENTKTERRLIAPDDLKAGVFYAMKQNLMVQLVYPDYELPGEYEAIIQSIDHHTIVPRGILPDRADVEVVNDWTEMPPSASPRQKETVQIWRTSKNNLFSCYEKLIPQLKSTGRLHVVITDMEDFREEDFSRYKETLSQLQTAIKELYVQGSYPQLNLLSDRILLDKMNNCNAGTEHITLAPNGKFYICPAFYQEDEADFIGDVSGDVDIKNRFLYRIDHAPLCRICDAYQCKRCVWLNRKTTLEVNTPSHEQCVAAHLERNASRELLKDLQSTGSYFPDKTIEAIDYLDPFEKRKIKDER